MNIAVISDTHFGYGWDTEREDDPFTAARDAFEQAAEKNADLILMPGDLFDARTPRQEVFSRAAEILAIPQQYHSTADLASEDSAKTMTFDGIPVVAIHGTHDRRSKGFVNPVELLEDFGCLLHLHTEHVVFEKNGERVAIHGMSGVPEAYAADVLTEWRPEPVPDAYNILLLHQNVEGFVYTDASVPALTLEDLPTGFDLIIDGHIHWPNTEDRRERKNLVFAGSTITTQMTAAEADAEKGFLTVDTTADTVTFNPLHHARSLFYEEVDVTGANTRQIQDQVAAIVDDHTNTAEQKPLIRIVLTGETDADISPAALEDAHDADAILSITRDYTSSTSTATQRFNTDKQHIADKGMELLQEQFPTTATDPATLFDTLAAGNLDEALTTLENITLDTLRDELTDTEQVNEPGDTEGEESGEETEVDAATTLDTFTADGDTQ